MDNAIIWTLWIMSFVCFFAYLYFALTSYQYFKKEPFRFQQQLPFELNEIYFVSNQRFRPFRWLIIVFAGLLFTYWETMFVIPQMPLTYVLLVLMTLVLLTTLGIFTLPTRRIEMYLMIVTTFFVAIAAMLFLASYLTFTSPFSQWQSFLPWTTLAQGVFQITLLLNPKLKQWALLEKVETGNEKPLFRRPTYFVMAYTQWLSLANVLLWVILTHVEWFIV